MSTEGVQTFMCMVWVVQTEPRGRLCQQRGAQVCVLCCADESMGRFVSTEGFTCVVYRLKQREREIVSKEGFKCTPVWFVLCRLKQREREIVSTEGVQTYTCMVCVVQVKAERDTV